MDVYVVLNSYDNVTELVGGKYADTAYATLEQAQASVEHNYEHEWFQHRDRMWSLQVKDEWYYIYRLTVVYPPQEQYEVDS